METIKHDLAEPYPVAADQCTRYRHDGHVLLGGVAAPNDIEHIRPLLVDLVESHAKSRNIQVTPGVTRPLFSEVENVWRWDEEVEEFVFSRRFAGIAAALMGVRRVRLYHDEAQIKEPGGFPTPWHKDHYNWPLATHHTIKMWLALTDLRVEMGTVLYVSGSHRAGQFPEVPPSYEANELFNRIIRTHKIPVVSYVMQAGDAVFYSGELLHSTLANDSDERREALAIIYYEDGTRVMEPNHDHRRVDLEEFLPGLKPGDVAASELNPILYSSD